MFPLNHHQSSPPEFLKHERNEKGKDKTFMKTCEEGRGRVYCMVYSPGHRPTDCRTERNMQASGHTVTEVTAVLEMIYDTVTGK